MVPDDRLCLWRRTCSVFLVSVWVLLLFQDPLSISCERWEDPGENKSPLSRNPNVESSIPSMQLSSQALMVVISSGSPTKGHVLEPLSHISPAGSFSPTWSPLAVAKFSEAIASLLSARSRHPFILTITYEDVSNSPYHVRKLLDLLSYKPLHFCSGSTKITCMIGIF